MVISPPTFQPKLCGGPVCLGKDGWTPKVDPKKDIREQFTGVGSPKVKAGVKVSARLW